MKKSELRQLIREVKLQQSKPKCNTYQQLRSYILDTGLYQGIFKLENVSCKELKDPKLQSLKLKLLQAGLKFINYLDKMDD